MGGDEIKASVLDVGGGWCGVGQAAGQSEGPRGVVGAVGAGCRRSRLWGESRVGSGGFPGGAGGGAWEKPRLVGAGGGLPGARVGGFSLVAVHRWQ